MTAIRITWPDGSHTNADDATDALAKIGRAQWEPIKGSEGSVAEVKSMLSDRAWAWSRVDVDVLLADDAFLVECAAANLFTIAIETTTTEETE